MRVVFIHGPAASGKHTIGSLLSARTGLPLFHNHLAVDLAKTLFEFGSEGFTQLRAKVWIAAFSEAATAGRSFIFTFHPEATVDPGLIEALVEIVESSGGEVCFVELQASRETVLRRLGNASRAKFGKLLDPDLYEQIESNGGFDFPALPTPMVVIDTDVMKAEDAAVVIEQALSRVA
ncbi:MAG: shikimate kinase [Gammaproteobacteria bacterium]|nr:shikimate kinase [Gammaproteobacteria bacterium]MDH5304968.1 shikimate kinase [Gammaproteobacteria bacterium]MDH5322006.1 shikimate kinase [Gammaproteobacteria bacterium]